MADAGLAIFDLDGTLADTRADLAAAVNFTRRAIGLGPIPDGDVVEALGNGLAVLLERTIPERPEIPAAEKRAIWMREYSAHWLDGTAAYPGMREALEELRQAGWRLAVLSNKPDEATRAIVEGLGLGRYFAAVQGGAPHLPLKPDPLSIGYVAEASGYDGDKGRIWMVGDNYTDLEAARRAGARSCFCRYGFGHPGSETPTAEVSSPSELPRILLAMRSAKRQAQLALD